MKKFIIPIAIITLFACGNAENHNNQPETNVQSTQAVVKNVNAEEFKSLVEKGNGIVLDVRTPQETAQGVIPNAVTIDFYAPDFKEQVNKLDKNKPVYVYCKSGGRSSNAAQILKDLGFKEIYNLNGGITAWQANGFETK
jgi:rhodanese-related sulfurtransferase